MAIPTREKCIELLDEYETPERARNHCFAVAKMAKAIGQALNKRGHRLNIELIEAAGLTHDMLRALEHHGEEAAKELSRLGFEEVAKLVYGHMRYSKFTSNIVDEEAIFCLCDRVILEDQYVGLEKRMDYIIQKALGSREVEKRIAKAKKEVGAYIVFLERKHLKAPLGSLAETSAQKSLIGERQYKPDHKRGL